MLRSKSLGIVFLLLFGLCVIGNTCNAKAYQLVTLDSNMEYNVKVGDVIGLFFNDTETEVIYGDVNENDTDEDYGYMRYQCSEYTPNKIVNGSKFTVVGFSIASYPYNPILTPDFTSSIGWTPQESKNFYVNKSLGSMFELSRIMIPNDIDLTGYFGNNASDFIYTLMLFISHGNSPVDQFRSLINQTESETELGNITFSNDNNLVHLTWSYDLIGYKYPSQFVNVTIRSFMGIDFLYETNAKRVCERLSMKMVRNMTIWNNISGFVRNTLNNQQVYDTLMYDSDPFGFWDIYGYTWLIAIVVVSGGVIAFFVFYSVKCKANPTYSAVCKVYRKSPPKSKQSPY